MAMLLEKIESRNDQWQMSFETDVLITYELTFKKHPAARNFARNGTPHMLLFKLLSKSSICVGSFGTFHGDGSFLCNICQYSIS